jgi:hypothetical protein
MIVAERKPVEEIQAFLQGHERVLVLGCGTCVTVCLAGGEREVSVLGAILRLANRCEIVEDTIERQCDTEFFDDIREQIESCDAVISMACGVGVQVVAEVFPDKPVYPALNTLFMGTNDEAGQWTENCLACGDCRLAEFGGVCPVTRCTKSLLNGPCGGSCDGMCEADPDSIECGWQLIFERLEALGQLDLLTRVEEPRDWSKTQAGGRRRLSREDVAGL